MGAPMSERAAAAPDIAARLEASRAAARLARRRRPLARDARRSPARDAARVRARLLFRARRGASRAAAADAAAADATDAADRAAALERHYLDVIPRLRTQQLDSTAPEVARVFDTPVEPAGWPRLAAAAARLGRADLLARAPTLGALYAESCYGAFMPMLYGSAYDLASYDGDALDRHLAAPLVHELAHGSRDHPILSLYVDECIAGWLGTRALDGDNDLYAAPWLSQVGAALARVVGAERLRAASTAGTVAWDDVLPPGLAAAVAAADWELEYLARTVRCTFCAARPPPIAGCACSSLPPPGCRLRSSIARGATSPPATSATTTTARILDDALARHVPAQSSGAALVPRPATPSAAGAGSTSTSTPARVATAAGADGFDPAPATAHLFPPATAARLRARGIAGYRVRDRVARRAAAARPRHPRRRALTHRRRLYPHAALIFASVRSAFFASAVSIRRSRCGGWWKKLRASAASLE